MFTYIKPEFMIAAFCQQRDTTLLDRSICVARLGDFAVTMERVDDHRFSLSLENATENTQYAGKIFDIDKSTKEEIATVVDDLFKKMQYINEKQIFDNRENIWKMYALSWLKEQNISLDDYLDIHMTGEMDEQTHWESFEEYMSHEYLNVGSTMRIIEEYAQSDEEREQLKSFAAKDIVELRQRHSLEQMQEEFASRKDDFFEKKIYGFGIEVVAQSRDEAREKLQALLKDTTSGEFIIRG